MEIGDIRYYLNLLKSLDEIEQQEGRDLTIEERWKKHNTLVGLGRILGWKEDDSDVEIVRARWVKIKEHYEKTTRQS